MRILIGVDGSSSSDAAIEEAARRPWPKGSAFKVLTVVDQYFFTGAPLLLEEVENSTLEVLKGQSKLLAEAGWPVEPEVILDNVRHALPRAATAWHAELVMLGSHGRSTLARLLMGSTAQAALRHAPCSVEIVRARGDREAANPVGMRIVVPTDGSEFADFAVRSVADRPWPADSTFKVIACPEYPVLVGEYPFYPPEKVAELLKSSSERAEGAARKGQQLLASAGLKADCEITEAEASPATAVLEVAEKWKADLIAIGSHGRRGFDRLILGSVSETVALHAGCSVEVVRKVQAAT